jgi:hypothetical protein
MSTMDEWYTEVDISNWTDLMKELEKYSGNLFTGSEWLFRGLSKKEYHLETTLERAAKQLGLQLIDLPIIEQGLIRKFYRQLANYEIYDIHPSDYFRIMALMQHYGSPTRLLDFTHSPFVGLHFAISNAVVDKAFTIWAINGAWLDKIYKYNACDEYKELIQSDPYEKTLSMMTVILNDIKCCVKHIGPFMMNERIIAQQGTFLAPLNICRSFEDNLIACRNTNEMRENIKRINITLDRNNYREVLIKLHNMTISDSTMYPGFEGFASHLKTLMVVPNTIAATSGRFILYNKDSMF